VKRTTSNEVFRGHLNECLQHYGAVLENVVPKGSKGVAEIRKPLAEFCGVIVSTVSRWLRDDELPTGDPLIKLMCYLDTIGYRVIEFEKMPQERRNFVELIGFGIITGEEATQLTDYGAKTSLYRVLHGKVNASREKEALMWDIWKERRAALEQKKAQARIDRALETKVAIPTAKIVALAPLKPSTEQFFGRNMLFYQMPTTDIVRGLLHVLEDRPFDSLPEKSLADLDENLETILRLSAELGILSVRILVSRNEAGGQ